MSRPLPSSSRRRVCVLATVLASGVLLRPVSAQAQAQPAVAAPAAPAAGGLVSEPVARGYRWAVNDLMRLYESIRLVADLETRRRLLERMRGVMEEWVNPLERTSRFHHSGKVPVQCPPDASLENVSCVARSIALAHVYYGLARGITGFTSGADDELTCASNVFPSIQDVELYLRRPPEYEDELGTDLMRAPEVRTLVQEAVRDERAKWPGATRQISYQVFPEPRPAVREAEWYKGPPLRLEEYPVIEAISVDDAHRAFYSRVASEELRRTLQRLYTYEDLGTDEASVCPDPRRLYLPPGDYVLYSSAERSLPQKFTVEDTANNFVFEHFSSARAGTTSGSANHRAAWYRAPCIGDKCGKSEASASNGGHGHSQ